MKKILIVIAIGIIAITTLTHNTEAPIVEVGAEDITTEVVDNNSQSETTDEEVVEEEVESQEEIEVEENLEQELAEEFFLQVVQENLGLYVDIEFDETDKVYTMTPTNQGLIDEISLLPTGVGHEGWGVLVDSMTSLSQSGYDAMGEGYSIQLVNPLNHDNVILWIYDGVVIYNVIDDL